MSFLQNIILSLPAVKKKISSIETANKIQIEKVLRMSAEEKSKLRADLQKENFILKETLSNEDVIMNKYQDIKNKQIILDTKVVHVKKQKAKYNLILVKTKHGDFKINVGRHAESGVGIGEHDPHHEKVKIR